MDIRPRPNKSVGLIGIGFMFLWLCALLFWVDLLNGYDTWKQVLGFIGAVFVSLSCLALAIYTSQLERAVHNLMVQRAEQNMAKCQDTRL